MTTQDPSDPHFAKALQLRLLNAAAAAYPNAVDGWTMAGHTTQPFNAALAYLRDHGLLTFKTLGASEGTFFAGIGPIKITAKGLDYLRSDGGLTAELNVVTVKLHEETIRQLLVAAIARSALPVDQKEGIGKRLAKLPAKALEKAIDRLIDRGLDRIDDDLSQLFQSSDSLPDLGVPGAGPIA